MGVLLIIGLGFIVLSFSRLGVFSDAHYGAIATVDVPSYRLVSAYIDSSAFL